MLTKQILGLSDTVIVSVPFPINIFVPEKVDTQMAQK